MKKIMSIRCGDFLLAGLLAAAVLATACAGGEGEPDPGFDFDVAPEPDADGEADAPPPDAEDPQPDAPDGEDPQPDGEDPQPDGEDTVSEDPTPDGTDTTDVPDEPEVPPTCGNGTIDPGEDCEGDASESCDTSCATTGMRDCTVACTWGPCVPPAETCNGTDDDCDGLDDEDFDCDAGAVTACTTVCSTAGQGTCTSDCHLPAPADCTPPAETCNGVDDDCDGQCDEDFGCCRGAVEDCTTPAGFAGTRTCSTSCGWEDCRVDCPAECQVLPSVGGIGAACTSDASCITGSLCLTEESQTYNGETYTLVPGGVCITFGAETTACSIDDPTSCPTGSTCTWLSSYLGVDYYGCWDACIPTDSSGRVYDFNCSCREGYTCDITSSLCTTGCSNDRECCERWWDLNDDGLRQTGEVSVKSGCTNTCDDEPSGFCEAAYDCINNGDTTNRWAGPCEGDAWCPPDGRCLDAFYYTDDAGDPLLPGGYCIKDACQYVGRGCSDYGGECGNLGSTDDPFWVCVGRCHFGRSILDPSYECRTLPHGQEQACFPAESDFWLTAPADGSDGYCWPGNFEGGTGDIGTACASDAACDSPYGLGFCLAFTGITAPSFCSATCTQSSAESFALCGGDDGSGSASGACWSGVCWEGCGVPSGAPGSNGCIQASMACYDVSRFADVYKDSASSMPAGLCVPPCTSDAWCADFWGMAMTCNTTTRVCG